VTTNPARPLEPGDPAPSFTLPTVPDEGFVSLADYRGKSPVLLALMRGLYCAFCRRHIAQLGTTREKLRAIGVETLASWPHPPSVHGCTIVSGPWAWR